MRRKDFPENTELVSDRTKTKSPFSTSLGLFPLYTFPLIKLFQGKQMQVFHADDPRIFSNDPSFHGTF